VLHVVETNPFRHLNHLSLKLVPASDLYLKKYLAKCLLELKVRVVREREKSEWRGREVRWEE
jgi:spindle assembly abnormal protein 6